MQKIMQEGEVHPLPIQVAHPYWPVPGERVKILSSSVFYAGGLEGEVQRPRDGGWEVKVVHQDSFAGEKEATEKTIWAETVGPITEETK